MSAADFSVCFFNRSASSRAISSLRSAIRSVGSPADSSVRSCPISCASFFFGLSSSSTAGMVLPPRPQFYWRQPALSHHRTTAETRTASLQRKQQGPPSNERQPRWQNCPDPLKVHGKYPCPGARQRLLNQRVN